MPNSPFVSVPVLSKTTQETFRIISTAFISRINIPFFAAKEVVIVVTIGIAKPSACGQAITITAIASVPAKITPWGLTKNQKTNTLIPTMIAVKVSHFAALSASFWTGGLVYSADRTNSIIDRK